MAKLSLLFLSLFFCFSTFAQNIGIGNVNSAWTFRPQRMQMFDPIFAYRVSYLKDSIINGNTYQSFGQKEDISPLTHFYLRNTNNKVYFYENNQEKLLFDFSLQAGDTLKYQVPQVALYYDIYSGSSFNENLFAYAIIDSIKTEIIGGQALSSFYTSPIDIDYSQNDMDWHLGKVIANIGGFDWGLFGSSCTQLLWGIGDGQLVCYNDKTIHHKHPNVTNCDEFVEMDNAPEQVKYTFFYDNINEELHLHFDRSKEIYPNIRCYNVMGQEVKITLHLGLDNEYLIKIQGENGIYFFQFEGNSICSIKVLKD